MTELAAFATMAPIALALIAGLIWQVRLEGRVRVNEAILLRIVVDIDHLRNRLEKYLDHESVYMKDQQG